MRVSVILSVGLLRLKHIYYYYNFVTVYEKTRHTGIFAKIEIALYMSSTNLDLTLLQI